MATTLEIMTKNNLDKLMAAPFARVFDVSCTASSSMRRRLNCHVEAHSAAANVATQFLHALSVREALDLMSVQGAADSNNLLCILVEDLNSAAKAEAHDELRGTDRKVGRNARLAGDCPMSVDWGLVGTWLELEVAQKKSPERGNTQGFDNDTGFDETDICNQYTPAPAGSQEAAI